MNVGNHESTNTRWLIVDVLDCFYWSGDWMFHRGNCTSIYSPTLGWENENQCNWLVFMRIQFLTAQSLTTDSTALGETRGPSGSPICSRRTVSPSAVKYLQRNIFQYDVMFSFSPQKNNLTSLPVKPWNVTEASRPASRYDAFVK